MEVTSLIVTIIVGAIAGWLAGVIVEGAGFGLLINVLLGIAGAFIAALLFPRLGLGLDSGRWRRRGHCHFRTRRDCLAPNSQLNSAPNALDTQEGADQSRRPSHPRSSDELHKLARHLNSAFAWHQQVPPVRRSTRTQARR